MLSSIPNATNRYSKKSLGKRKEVRKKRKIQMIEIVSINVKRPHALLECKEMLVVISTSFKVDYCLIYERGSQAVSFSFFFF